MENNQALAAAPDNGNAGANKKKKSKGGSGFAKITYLVALLCLIAGLALPLEFDFEHYLDKILAWQLPAALNIVLGKKVLDFGATTFMASHPINIWGALSFDLGAYLTLLYALFTVLGVIFLIFVLLSKKAVGKASFIEGFALLFLLPLIYIQLLFASVSGYNWLAYAPLFIAAGGTLLMVILQAFVYKKSSGFMKLIMFLFSGIALVGCIYPITAIVPALESPLKSLADIFGGKFSATGLYDGGDGILHVTMLLHSDYLAAISGLELMKMIMAIAALALSVLVIINFTLDTLGLAKRTKKYMLVFNIIRYFLELAAAGTVIVLGFVTDAKLGLPVLIIAVLALLQFIINIIRSITYTKRKKAAEKRRQQQEQMARRQQQIARQQQLYGGRSKGSSADAAAANAYFQNADERRAAAQAEREQRRKERLEQREKAKAELEASLQAEQAANDPNSDEYVVKQIYKGPTDEFIKELNNDEKIEFAKVFLERSENAMPDIPEYVIGGSNEKFFSSIFIYYGRLCDRISGGLMNKIYECGYNK